MTEWIENTGTVPDDVGPDTVIEVEYSDGEVRVWRMNVLRKDDPNYWAIMNDEYDIIRWRKVE